eukprot:GHVU01151548.1.p1 GENE.GHVU01151548.1~~GHVU01151548.1.p1  ORF type:complete len:118 (+),score=11.36 GHVU01151548.1:1967-2320(+)
MELCVRTVYQHDIRFIGELLKNLMKTEDGQLTGEVGPILIINQTCKASRNESYFPLFLDKSTTSAGKAKTVFTPLQGNGFHLWIAYFLRMEHSDRCLSAAIFEANKPAALQKAFHVS